MMIKRISILLILGMGIAGVAQARPLIADLSLRTVEIDSGFTGTEILLFGARNDAGDVVVVVRGPKMSYVVRKKDRVAGIWVNKNQVNFERVDGFYAMASSRPLDTIRNDYLLSELEIGVDNVKFPVRDTDTPDMEEFRQALRASQVSDNLYTPSIGEVSFIGDTLFRTIIRFPKNILRGTYVAEVYLFSDGQLSGVQTTPLLVHKKGFDAFMFDLAYQYSAVYGVLCVALALLAGWFAGLIFRKVA